MYVKFQQVFKDGQTERSMMAESKRKRTARNTFYDINLAEFIEPYEELAKAYNDLYFIKKQRMKQAYIVTFVDDPTLIYVAFSTNKEKSKVKYKAVKYFKDMMHPQFMSDESVGERFKAARPRRYPDFDKYVETERIPILELMRLGIRFPCTHCGKGAFNRQLVNLKQAIIIEGEGNLNPFTEGIILCKKCYGELDTKQTLRKFD